MIDIEILSAILKELGYLDDSKDEDDKEEYAKDESNPKPVKKT